MMGASRTCAILCLSAAALLSGTIQAQGQGCPIVTSENVACPAEPVQPEVSTCPEEPSCPQVTVCPTPLSCPTKPSVPLAADLEGLCGTDFDQAYARQMYDLNLDIASLAGCAAANTQDPKLREFYAKIRRSRLQENTKLGRVIQPAPCPTEGKTDAERAAALQQSTGMLSGIELDRAYAGMMKGLLQKSASLAVTARTRAAYNRLREQANDQARVDARNMYAISSWIATGNLENCLRGQWVAFAR